VASQAAKAMVVLHWLLAAVAACCCRPKPLCRIVEFSSRELMLNFAQDLRFVR